MFITDKISKMKAENIFNKSATPCVIVHGKIKMDILKKLRKKAKKTQAQLASTLGITQAAYSMYESGQREPDFNTLIKLADYFNVSIDHLLGRADNPNIQENSKYSVLIDKYEQLNKDDRAKVIGYIDGLLTSKDTNPELSATTA